MRLHAREIGQHALDQRARALAAASARSAMRLERELQAGERGLELVRDECEEAVLLLEHARLGAQRARDHGDARRRAPAGRSCPPRRTGWSGGAPRSISACLDRADASAARPRVTAMSGSSSCTRARSCRHRAAPARRRSARRRRARARRTFSTRVGVLVVEPPAHLHRGHHDQRERGELEDAGGFHRQSAATVASDSRSAWAKRARSAPPCASDRKQAS